MLVLAVLATAATWPSLRRVVAATRLSRVLTALPHRVSTSRLIGSPYRPAVARYEAIGVNLQITTRQIINQTDDPRVRAQARLILGDSEAAIDELRNGVADRDAARLSDLAAALLADAERLDSVDRTLDAAHTARQAITIAPRLAAAHFNLGIALDRLGLATEARSSFLRAAALEPDSGWTDESLRLAHSRRRVTSTADWATADRMLRGATNADEAKVIIVRNADLARRQADAVYLRQWAQARIQGDRAGANVELELARKIGTTFAEVFGDVFIADSVAAVDAAEARGERSVLALGRAHILYIDGRLARRDRDDARAVLLLRDAAEQFRLLGSPLEFSARYYMAGGLYELAQFTAALSVLDGLEAESLDARGYRVLAAHFGWERGICLLARGAFAEALDRFERSREISVKIGAHDLAARFDGLAAEALEYLGESDEAWRRRSRLLFYASVAGDDLAKAVALTTAANLQIAAASYARAALLLDYASVLAERAGDPIVAADAFAQRSVARDELGDFSGAAADRVVASRWVRQIPAERSREQLNAQVLVAEGVAKRVTSPATAIAYLTRAIEFIGANNQWAMLPRLYLERARAHRGLNDIRRERHDLQASLDIIQRWEEGLVDIDQRAAIRGWSKAVRTDLISLQLRTADVSGAFWYADHRIGPETALANARTEQRLTLHEIRQALAPTATILAFVHLGERIVVFIVQADSVRVSTLPAPAPRIFDAIYAVRTADDSKFRAAAARAYDVLIAPIANNLRDSTTVAIVGGPEILQVSFGALLDRKSGRYLAENAAIVHATSAAAAVVLSKRSHAAAGGTFVAIGASAFDRIRYPDLDSLFFVDREAAQVASLWKQSRLLTGVQATAVAVRNELMSATVAHYAGHIAGRGSETRLLLANDQDRDGLSAREIARLPMEKLRVVVLAGCRGSDPSTDSVVGDMAAAFLAAGVSTVVASTVDVDDRASPMVMRRMHQWISHGTDPAEAVQRTIIQEAHTSERVPLALRLIVRGGSRALVSR